MTTPPPSPTLLAAVLTPEQLRDLATIIDGGEFNPTSSLMARRLLTAANARAASLDRAGAEGGEEKNVRVLLPCTICGQPVLAPESATAPAAPAPWDARTFALRYAAYEGGNLYWYQDEVIEAVAAAHAAGRAEGVPEQQLDGNRPLPFSRDQLGRMVREAWVRWAQTQPNPKPSWLAAYDDLAEPDQEADRQIGEAVARWTLIGDASQAALRARLAAKEGL